MAEYESDYAGREKLRVKMYPTANTTHATLMHDDHDYNAPELFAAKTPAHLQPVSAAPQWLDKAREVLQDNDPYADQKAEKKPQQAVDMVNSPSHYKQGNIEVIDFIEDQKFGYLAGQVVKYVARARHKGSRLEDYKKAEWYLRRLITRKGLDIGEKE